MNTLEYINQHKLVAISRGVYGDNLLKAVEMVIKGGIRLLEITFNQASPSCLAETAASILKVKEKFGDELCVGAGTVMTPQQARAAASAGADFCLSPNTDPEVIEEIKKAGLIAVPGAATPSEIATAHNAGADIVKLFPAGIYGTAYLDAIRGPLNHIPLMAVGGVSADNVREFLSHGCCSAGIGSNIISAKRIAAGDFESVYKAAAAFIEAIK